MRRPVSTPVFEESGEVAVACGVVGLVVLPAAPEYAGPGSAEDAGGVWVLAAAGGGALVGVVGPGVPVAGAVGEHADVVAQALVAGPAEGGVAAFVRFLGDGGLAGVGGEAVGGRVAGAVVADLGQQAGGGDDALGIAEGAQEDWSVGVRADGAGDLAGEQADLLDDRAQGDDKSGDGGATCLCLELADRGGRGAAQAFEQLLDGSSSAVGVAGQESVQALGAQSARVDGARVAGKERERDRTVDVGEDSCGAGPTA